MGRHTKIFFNDWPLAIKNDYFIYFILSLQPDEFIMMISGGIHFYISFQYIYNFDIFVVGPVCRNYKLVPQGQKFQPHTQIFTLTTTNFVAKLNIKIHVASSPPPFIALSTFIRLSLRSETHCISSFLVGNSQQKSLFADRSNFLFIQRGFSWISTPSGVRQEKQQFYSI